MPRGEKSGRVWTDAELLEMLEQRSAGRSLSEVARAFRTSKGVVIGLCQRMAGPPSAQDGTLPPRWWAAGLAVPGRDAA